MPGIKKVLIVDDEIDLCLLLKDYFTRKKNYEVILSHSLLEGKSLVGTVKPDILFLDNNLPDGTGWSIAPEFAENFLVVYYFSQCISTHMRLLNAAGRTLPGYRKGDKYE